MRLEWQTGGTNHTVSDGAAWVPTGLPAVEREDC
jgi:hypothetical protein